MKNLTIALFVLFILSVEFYLYVPSLISVLLGAAFASTASVALAGWLSQRARVSTGGSLEL